MHNVACAFAHRELRNRVPSPPEEYVSVLFTSLLQPIADLFHLMDSSAPRGPNEVQASSVECGYSASIVVLSVFALESALNRTRYVREEPGRTSAVDTLRGLNARELAADVQELFVLRDVIAHNHLWRAKIAWDDGGQMRMPSAELLDGYGDAKFREAVDLKSRRTRRLGLDVFPTRIHRATAVAVLKKCVEVFRFLENRDKRFVYLGQPSYVQVGTQMVPFYGWVDGLKASA